ncbi:uncharacterized protein LOC128683512 [Plodia interpunctella]|uniref:uncharacterized protein LOC128683512 n=1 Tax=Plodia interpunctella TaxID=58824 RepID=UPI0023680503|nr:uncharacterized protein LOC128683512 [Plodia interpunctella]
MMLSKFLREAGRCTSALRINFLQVSFKGQKIAVPMKPLVVPARVMSQLIPPSQYDMPWSKKLQILYVMRTYWETIPLFLTTFFALFVLFCAISWACNNKVDIVFSANSRANISRTMDLRNPSIHKMRIINQRYPPWPELQDTLDKMKEAEKRALTRAQTCATP